MRIAQGTVVKPAGKEFETQYGVKVMLVVKLDDGNEEKFYINPDHDNARLERNNRVSVIFENRDGRTIRRLVSEEGRKDSNINGDTIQPGTNATNSGSNGSNYTKKQYTAPAQPEPREWINCEVQNVIATMSLIKAHSEFVGMELPIGEIRNIAVSIMINAQKTFRSQVDFTPAVTEESKEDKDNFEETVF